MCGLVICVDLRIVPGMQGFDEDGGSPSHPPGVIGEIGWGGPCGDVAFFLCEILDFLGFAFWDIDFLDRYDVFPRGGDHIKVVLE